MLLSLIKIMAKKSFKT